jgi:transcriptional regulator with XRE-family HTH domain
MDIREKFGLRIRELRKKKKWTQEELAHNADIDRTYMTDVENGKRNIGIRNIAKLLKALDVSFGEFFKGMK